MGRRRVDRLGSGDVVELVTDVGPAPRNIAVLLVLAPGGRAEDVAAVVGRRLAGDPRLRRRLQVPPRWRGRPSWQPEGTVDLDRHVTLRTVQAPEDAVLLRVTAEETGRRLPRSAPLWRAVVLADPDGGALGVVLVLHHVVADGVAGLHLLARLVDDAEPSRPHTVRRADRSPPTRHPPRLAPRSSLNAPTGPRRALHVATVELAPLLAAARRHGATVNDVLLVATTAALREALAARGEHPSRLVVSVPVAVGPAGPDRGNRVAVMPVDVPLPGDPVGRLHRVAATTRGLKSRPTAAAALFPPVARAAAALGVFQHLIDRQRLVNTFLSNLRGPGQEQHLAGIRVVRVVPVSGTGGNVAVAFGALSYAGTLLVTVVTDPDVAPEGARIACSLRAELEALTRSSPPPPGSCAVSPPRSRVAPTA